MDALLNPATGDYLLNQSAQGAVNADFTLGVDNLTAAGFDIVVNSMPLNGSSAADFKGVYWIAIGK